MYIKLRELIVTQWDVNGQEINAQGKKAQELIVTQWDVNAAGAAHKLTCSQN